MSTHDAILVVGDAMLDRYLFGQCSRISPEAPVPVIHVQKTQDVAGGAANVAVNAANLGAKITLLSVIGNDLEGKTLQSLLEASNITCAFVHDNMMPTTVKMRLIARNQHVVRADFEQRPDPALLWPMVDHFEKLLSSCSTVIFCDYNKGALTHLRPMMAHAKRQGIRTLIDPKGTDYTAYHGATLITPNCDEFKQVAGCFSDESDFEHRAFTLRDRLELSALLVTRSEEGMSLFIGDRHVRIFTEAREVFDVSGAGDTVIATMAVALNAGRDMEAAARLANMAAGIVVGKVGTAPITHQELAFHV